ncbi:MULTISPECIES: carbohydrate ABC transporter permease [unclassified Mesorhizobium]|uniref:carbohydrate ABC transporter permease n=1 Tax=unclassified Mesorhizobium TaxID=325217 RepID=UPI00333D4424
MRSRRLAIGAGKTLAVAAIVVWSLFPIGFIVLSSFKPGREIFAVPPELFFEPTFEHYASLWQRWPAFFDGLVNSLIITTGATALAVMAGLLAGFAYSRYRGVRFLEGSVLFLIGSRLIPPIVVTLPLFPVANRLGLNDTHLVLILLYATFFVSLGTLLMRTFIDQVPRELDEAAVLDGARPLTILVKIILPLVAPGMLAVAVFVVVFAWNEFLFAYIFTANHAKTAPLVLSEMISSIDGVDWGVLFAASTVQLLPVLVFVVLMNRFLVAGLTAGATKG